MQALGPSDNSDSGSDVTGAYSEEQLSSDSDSSGTGERSEVGLDSSTPGADILPDHIETEGGHSALVLPEEARQALHDLDDVENIADDTADREAGEDKEVSD